MKKRVLHIAEASGGVERYLMILLKKMQKYPDYEHVLVCSSALNQAKFKSLVKDVVVVKDMHNPISIFRDFKSVLNVRRVIKYYSPDVVYCHSSKAGAIGRLADYGINNRMLYNAHGWAFDMKGVNTRKIKFYVAIEKILAKTTDVIVCISENEKRSALEHGICTEEKLIVINNGIDFDEYTNRHPKSREELGIPADAFVVGTIGRITRQKATDVFVKMALAVKKTIPNAFFIIVGDDIANGQFRNEVDELIDELGMKKNILITGWVDDPLDYLDVFDVATLFSRWEGFGLVLLEYMCMEKPIVASRVGAIPYVLGEAGLLVDENDYQEASCCIARLHGDKDYRLSLVERAKERINLFNAENTAKETISLFVG